MKNFSKISLRKANFSDIEFLWYLRNQPEVFRFFKNPRGVEWQEHINWIVPIILGKTNKELFVASLDKKLIGQLRLDMDENKNIEVSISLAREFQGGGLGAGLLGQGIKLARKRKARALLAEIHQDNIASQKLFEKFGFELKGQDGVWKVYILKI